MFCMKWRECHCEVFSSWTWWPNLNALRHVAVAAVRRFGTLFWQVLVTPLAAHDMAVVWGFLWPFQGSSDTTPGHGKTVQVAGTWWGEVFKMTSPQHWRPHRMIYMYIYIYLHGLWDRFFFYLIWENWVGQLGQPGTLFVNGPMQSFDGLADLLDQFLNSCKNNMLMW